MTDKLIFAIPKGRILDDALPYIEAAGLMPEADFFDKKCRALRFATARNDMDMIRVRAFDVASFVAHGAAHIGIVGSDVIEEFAYSELYAPVDLNFGHCRLSVARRTADADSDILDSSTLSHIRIATKYPNITKRYFAQKGIQAECVKLNGAMELAPSLGLSRHIVDLVESGRTLLENGLEECQEIMPVSARLIVNRAALKVNHTQLGELITQFRNMAAKQAA